MGNVRPKLTSQKSFTSSSEASSCRKSFDGTAGETGDVVQGDFADGLAGGGLSENWSGNYHQQGHFDQQGSLPEVAENVELIKGWVDDTFAPFLDKHDGPIAYLHVDTDTYSPAKTILSQAKTRLVPGTIILFDELFGYPAWEHHEYRALNETLPDDCYEFVGFSQMEAALRITKAPDA